MNIEILKEGISACRYGFIVWDEGGVVEVVQIKPFRQRTGHVYLMFRVASSHVQKFAGCQRQRPDGLTVMFARMLAHVLICSSGWGNLVFD